MSNLLPENLEEVISQFSRLPGIGPRSAERLAFHLLKSPTDKSLKLSIALKDIKHGINFCRDCFMLTKKELCSICDDNSRDRTTLCIVSDISDLIAIEKTNEFKGIYHILHGHLSPLEGVGPDDLKISELIARIENSPEIKEVILATNPTLEGDATAMFLQDAFTKFPCKVTRIARGMPVGGDLDYADSLTISRAMQGRQEF